MLLHFVLFRDVVLADVIFHHAEIAIVAVDFGVEPVVDFPLAVFEPEYHGGASSVFIFIVGSLPYPTTYEAYLCLYLVA